MILYGNPQGVWCCQRQNGRDETEVGKCQVERVLHASQRDMSFFPEAMEGFRQGVAQ